MSASTRPSCCTRRRCAPCWRSWNAATKRRYDKPWWRPLLEQPPRHWSEFASCQRYLCDFQPPNGVAWRDDSLLGYIFEAQDPQAVREAVAGMMADGRALRHDPLAEFRSRGSGGGGGRLFERLLPLLDAA